MGLAGIGGIIGGVMGLRQGLSTAGEELSSRVIRGGVGLTVGGAMGEVGGFALFTLIVNAIHFKDKMDRKWHDWQQERANDHKID